MLHLPLIPYIRMKDYDLAGGPGGVAVVCEGHFSK